MDSRGRQTTGQTTHPENGGRLQAFVKLGLTCSSAIAAEAVTYPVDMLKTRLQLQGELSAPGSRRMGAFGLAISVVRREGASAMYAGLSPALVRHVFYTGTRITVYEQLRSAATPSHTRPHSGEGIASLPPPAPGKPATSLQARQQTAASQPARHCS